MDRQSSYVYLLVDTRDESVFYVGKGTGRRALDHLVEAQAGMRNDVDSATETLVAVDKQEDEAREALLGKAEFISSIYKRGDSVRIDVLRTGLSSTRAFEIESAVIDAIGLKDLQNKQKGSGAFRYPAVVVSQLEGARLVELTHPAVVVGVSGVWGSANELSGLIDANEDATWENARHAWKVGAGWRRVLAERATTKPAMLIAVATGDPLWRGIVLGVWEIGSIHMDTTHDDRWAFDRIQGISTELAAARKRYLGNQLAEDGARFFSQQGVRYSQALKDAPDAQ